MKSVYVKEQSYSSIVYAAHTVRTERFLYGPWHGPVYRWNGTPDVHLQIVEFLLEHGADPNKLHTIKLTNHATSLCEERKWCTGEVAD